VVIAASHPCIQDSCNVSSPFLSIIIPAYNEEARLSETLPLLKAYLDRQEYSSEVVLVDDGSEDRTTEVFHEFFTPERGRSFKNAPNRGKGYSIRRGVEEARGEVVLFSDADFSTPIEEFPKLHQHIQNGFDVAIGSRSLPESDVDVRQAWVRESMGKMFNLLVQGIILRGFKDTQCGFKCVLRKDAVSIFSKMTIDGFGYDVEFLFLAQKNGLKIKETPVLWRNHPDSRVRIVQDSFRMLMDLITVRFRDWFGQYD
jgi:dolichyl-phosphate beta-glucosyltransferase